MILYKKCTAFAHSTAEKQQTKDKCLLNGYAVSFQPLHIYIQRQPTGFVNRAEFQQFNEHEHIAAVFIEATPSLKGTDPVLQVWWYKQNCLFINSIVCMSSALYTASPSSINYQLVSMVNSRDKLENEQILWGKLFALKWHYWSWSHIPIEMTKNIFNLHNFSNDIVLCDLCNCCKIHIKQ